MRLNCSTYTNDRIFKDKCDEDKRRGNNMLRRNYWYKKTYRRTWIEMFFMVVLTLTLIIEMNLTSHTLSISNSCLKLLGVIVLAFLTLLIQVRANLLVRDIEKGEREIFSFISRKYLLIVKRFTFVTLFPLFITIFSKQDNKQLFGILVSAILIILFKNYLDLIVTFSSNGYSSGFHDIRLDSDAWVKRIKESTHPIIGNVITFELYFGDRFKGYDKFIEEEYLILMKNLEMKEDN